MLRLQGLQPSSRQFDEWREAYGDLFTRQQFVEAMVRPRPSRPALASPAPAQLPPPPTPLSARPFPAQMGFVSSRQMSFKTTEWSSSKVCCTRIDCIPLGADEVKMTPDTFTIEQTQSPSVQAPAAAAGLRAAERSEAATGDVAIVETRTMAAQGLHRRPVKSTAGQMAE